MAVWRWVDGESELFGFNPGPESRRAVPERVCAIVPVLALGRPDASPEKSYSPSIGITHTSAKVRGEVFPFL